MKQPKYLDGPGLAELVHERLMGTPASEISDAFYRQLKRWEEGVVVHYFLADKYLMQLPNPIHEWELDGLWVDQTKKRSNCRRGHAFTPENSYYEPNGQRRCRACLDLRNKGTLPPLRGVHPESAKKKAARLYRLGKRRADLAREFDVSERTIGRWVKAYG